MNDQTYHFTYDFHPVGQGLFASGFLRQDNQDEPFFRWVYDCGTSSSQNLVDEAISRLDDITDHCKHLDLVTLSHFDHDHISGICRLAGKFEIETLMLPYMAQEQRLWMAFEEDVSPSDNLMGFFVNPTRYLSGLEGAHIRNILYVLPSGDGGPLEQPIEPRNEQGQDDENGERMQIEAGVAPGGDDPATTNVNSTIQVQFLRRGGTIRPRNYWEFVPYNDDTDKAIPDEFREKVQSERNNLVQGASPDKHEQALKELKELYQKQFGKGSKERNIISLFLLAGPVYAAESNIADLRVNCYQDYRHHYPHNHMNCRILFYGPVPAKRSKSSILYTGDGYLDNHERLTRLTRFLRWERVERVGVMQVMHHGSETNWHKGVAATFEPLVSVFSSDPDRKKWGHPHDAVLRDFWSYCPLQVDKSRSASIEGWMRQS